MKFYRWRPHPWHGLDVGADAPKLANAYIEICPFHRLTYKLMPGEPCQTSMGEAYGQPHAEKVIRAAIEDYENEFGTG
jgi:hypothetical protein